MKNISVNLKEEGIAIAKIVIGCFLYALSVVWFIDPAQLIPGSVTGIGVVVKALTGFPIGMLSIIINIPLVIIGTIKLGKRLLLYTGFTVLLSSAMIDALNFLGPFTNDLLLASVFGGVVMGIGLGLILDAGGTTGGTTVVGRLVSKKYPHIPMGDILLIGDFVIIMVGSMLLRNWDSLLYSIIDLYVCVVVLNKVMYGHSIQTLSILNTARAAELIQELKKQKLCKVLYSDEKKVIVISKKGNVSKIQYIAQNLDESTFCTAIEADYTYGNIYD